MAFIISALRVLYSDPGGNTEPQSPFVAVMQPRETELCKYQPPTLCSLPSESSSLCPTTRQAIRNELLFADNYADHVS